MLCIFFVSQLGQLQEIGSWIHQFHMKGLIVSGERVLFLFFVWTSWKRTEPLMTLLECSNHEGNTEEENNGYVVFKWNTYYGSAWKQGGDEREGGDVLLLPIPPLSTAGIWMIFRKTTWTVSPPPRIFSRRWSPRHRQLLVLCFNIAEITKG